MGEYGGGGLVHGVEDLAALYIYYRIFIGVTR